MKKLLIVITALFTSTVLAKTTTSDLFTGFYAGAGVTHANLNTNETINESVAGVSQVTLTNNAGFNQVGGKLLAGYGKAFNHYYVGLETTYQYLPTSGGDAIKNGQSYASDGFSGRNNWFLGVRGGYICDEHWMPYIFLGPSYTQFKFSAQNLAVAPYNMQHTSSNIWGVTPGIGIQYMLNENFGFDLKYSYTYYSGTTSNLTPAAPIDNFEVKFKPNTSIFGLSILYRF